MSEAEIVENFYGVYLLKSLNPKYKGRTYIGFTVDPNRRIKQHNRGKNHGGAWRTSQRGPWEMILIVYGFPSEVSALRFEWAWQHPKRSRRLKSIISHKKSSESSLYYNIKIMFIMLSTPPWKRLPLTVRWISANAVIDAPANLSPPVHMPITYGDVVTRKIKETKNGKETELAIEKDNGFLCQICENLVTEKDLLTCLNINCGASWHLLCIADKFLEDEILCARNTIEHGTHSGNKHIIPIEGFCPQCKCCVLWGDLIRRKNGCYNNLNKSNSS